MSHAPYLADTFTRCSRRITFGWAIKHLRSIHNEFDTIAITGVSGIMGAILAHELDKELIVVRKGEKRHSKLLVEGPRRMRNLKYVFVDDFASSGATLRYVVKQISQRSKTSKIVAMFSYRTNTLEYSKFLSERYGIEI